MKIDQILKEVLNEIKPEGIPEVANFLEKLNNELKKQKINAKAVFGGSFAKGVWLKGDYDVDIFVKFSTKYKSEELSDLLAKALKKFKSIRVHGSRDYFHIRNKVNYEIVPVLNIKRPEHAKNVTDFSPWHVDWVNLKGNDIKKEIMIAKKFMKAQGVYGAENYIRGFSGHVVDIIVIYYGGFLKLLRASLKWSPKQVIDICNHYKGKALLILNKSKTEGPLVVIDPVQPDRNAAAAVSEEKFNKLIRSANEFLKNPSKKFFVEKKIDLEKLKQNNNVLILEAKTFTGKEDIIGAKTLKAFEFLKKELNEFRISSYSWEWNKQDKAVFWFLLKTKELPKTFIRQGPPLKMKDHVKRFKQKYKKTIIKNKRICGVAIRKTTKLKDVLKKIIKDKYLSDKIISIK